MSEVGKLAEVLNQSLKGTHTWPRVTLKRTEGESPVKFDEMGREDIIQDSITNVIHYKITS